MSAPTVPVANRLLERLPAKDRDRILAHCELIALAPAAALCAPGDEIRQIHFPVGSFISSAVPMGEGHRLEVALIGDEGVHDVAIALGATKSVVHAVVQGGGAAWRMHAAAFRLELARTPALRDCLQRYARATLAQVMQTAGCSRFHLIEQRVARWLLMTADRSHGRTLHVTHETLASMLGVRRVGVTEAASALQARKLIFYVRGDVTIVNRRGLESAACSCYRSDITAYDRAFA